jgi:hypothetical protein
MPLMNQSSKEVIRHHKEITMILLIKAIVHAFQSRQARRAAR